VTASTDEVRSEVRRLAGVLLVDVDEIAERGATRMQELLPAYARVPRAELVPVVVANTRNVLEAVGQPGANHDDAEAQYRVSGTTRARQGITSDEMLNGWRIGLEVVREEAQARADGLGIGKDALLEFVIGTLQWGDVGMRASASAHHEAEIRELGRLVVGQRALRRVATLVAQSAEPTAVFEAVAGETLTLMEADSARVCRYEPDRTATVLAERNTVGEPIPAGTRLTLKDESVTAQVLRTQRPSARNSLEGDGTPLVLARERGLRSAVGAPIIVEGRLWGVIVAHWTRSDPVTHAAEARINEFAELVAAAIANAESRDALGQLAEEQAALRRVATLVAQGGQPGDVLDTVAAELADVLRGDHVVLCRYESGSELTVLAYRGTSSPRVPAGARINHEGDSVEAIVRRTERSARLESHEGARGTIAELARAAGVQVAVGAPVVVDGRLWGVASAAWNRGQPPPADTEERMARFAELLATAIANADSRAALTRLADEQAALRRVAVRVAEGAPPAAVFEAVTVETLTLLGADSASFLRYEPDGTATILAERNTVAHPVPPGTRLTIEGDSVTARILRTQRSCRIGDVTEMNSAIATLAHERGLRSAVAAPIMVDGRLWGVIVTHWARPDPPTAEAETQIDNFAQLVATAIANANSRDQLTASRARVLTTADEARRRVVRDLHDGAQQRLLQTIVTLKLAQRALEPGNPKPESLIAEALMHAQRGNAELRELAHGLLPAVLTQGGLRSGISSIVSRLDLLVEVDVINDRFAPEIEASAYFVVAEALTNVVKHSNAERAEVRAFEQDGTLHVEVRDDGDGGADPRGSGLVGLSDRVTALDGQLTVQSPVRGGTILAATLPLRVG
jgi:signal transduction histidine kinase